MREKTHSNPQVSIDHADFQEWRDSLPHNQKQKDES
jgi:hypothetical protein